MEISGWQSPAVGQEQGLVELWPFQWFLRALFQIWRNELWPMIQSFSTSSWSQRRHWSKVWRKLLNVLLRYDKNDPLQVLDVVCSLEQLQTRTHISTVHLTQSTWWLTRTWQISIMWFKWSWALYPNQWFTIRTEATQRESSRRFCRRWSQKRCHQFSGSVSDFLLM